MAPQVKNSKIVIPCSRVLCLNEKGNFQGYLQPSAAPITPPIVAAFTLTSAAEVACKVAATPPAACIVPTPEITVPNMDMAEGTSAPARHPLRNLRLLHLN